MLIPNKVDFKTKNATNDKQEHFIMIEGSTHEEDMAIINIYVLNNRSPKNMKQKLTEITIIVEDFNDLVLIMDRITRQKVYKEVVDLNNSINQLDR